jgi:hypothetical protein
MEGDSKVEIHAGAPKADFDWFDPRPYHERGDDWWKVQMGSWSKDGPSRREYVHDDQKSRTIIESTPKGPVTWIEREVERKTVKGPITPHVSKKGKYSPE